MRDGRYLLQFTSDLWATLYGGARTLGSLLGVEAEILKRLYFQVLRVAAPAYLDSMPIFREDFWHLVTFRADEGVGGAFRYLLPAPYVEIPFLFNRIYEPTIIARAGADYRLEVTRDRTHLVFEDDPFARANYPIRDLGTTKEITFFAPKVYTDEQDLYKLFGYLTSIVRPSSEQYRQLIKGVLYLFGNGPILYALNAGLQLAAGYPVSREADVVVEITRDAEYYHVRTRNGHTYDIPLRATLAVEVGSVLRPLSTFVSDIRVMDYLSDPEWWKGGVDNQDPTKRVVTYLPQELVPQLPDDPVVNGQVKPGPSRDDAAVIDRVFDEYLKYSVMGVKYSTAALGNFKALEEFFGVLWDVKPHWQAPYTNAYFKVDELVDLGSDDTDIAALVELTRLVLEDPAYDAAEYVRRRGRFAMGAGLKVGAGDWGVLEDFSHEQAELAWQPELEHARHVGGGPWILNSRRTIGHYPDGTVWERARLAACIEVPPDTFDLGLCTEQVSFEAEEIPESWFDQGWFAPSGPLPGPPPGP